MTALDWYGVGTLALIVVAFYFVRRIALFVVSSLGIALAFGLVTRASFGGASAAAWIVMILGIPACAFGLLIVRVMLIRSVSLRMLGAIEHGQSDARFTENVGERLADMRAFHLVRCDGKMNELTPFGWFVSAVVSALYSLLGIRA